MSAKVIGQNGPLFYLFLQMWSYRSNIELPSFMINILTKEGGPILLSLPQPKDSDESIHGPLLVTNGMSKCACLACFWIKSYQTTSIFGILSESHGKSFLNLERTPKSSFQTPLHNFSFLSKLKQIYEYFKKQKPALDENSIVQITP